MIDAQLTDLELILRLTGATASGAILGINRDLRRKPAGLRTHAIVSLGAALCIVATLRLGGEATNSVARVIQGLVAGIGFLGGGVIVKTHDGDGVSGLTTAASVWLAAGLGITCAIGEWVPVLAAVALALLVLTLGGPFEKWLRVRFGGKVSAP